MLRAILCVLLLLNTVTWAQQRAGPTSLAKYNLSLQAAIYRAEEGATIEAWRYSPRIPCESIVIDKPLTLIGAYCELDCGPSFVLEGPGYGRVTLVGVYVVPAPVRSCWYWSGTRAITATGFDEVRLIDCHIQGGDAYFFSGEYGGSAMEADGVPRLVLKRSELRAGSSAWFPDYTCAAVVWPYVAPAAVSAPGALVIVQDSLLVGGNGIRYCFGGVDQCSTENPWQTGQGGPGLVADRLYYRRSTFTGGSGDSWTNRPEIGAAGAPFVVNDVDEIVGNRRHAR